MEKFSVGEVVEMAVQTERLGYRFYTEMAAKFHGSEGLASLFKTLASKEQAHERIFEGLKGRVTDVEPEGWTEAQPYFRAMVESEFFIGKGKSLPSMDHIASVAEAVDFALGFEKETLLYFVGMRPAVMAIGDRGAVDEIIEEEMSHISWLKNFKETLKS